MKLSLTENVCPQPNVRRTRIVFTTRRVSMATVWTRAFTERRFTAVVGRSAWCKLTAPTAYARPELKEIRSYPVSPECVSTTRTALTTKRATAWTASADRCATMTPALSLRLASEETINRGAAARQEPTATLTSNVLVRETAFRKNRFQPRN